MRRGYVGRSTPGRLYIPQYTPRANSIEAGFSQMNRYIEEDIRLANGDPEKAIHEALLQKISAELAT